MLGVSAEEISTLSAEAVDWPDASLGCPQPGMIYAQVSTPGFHVVLEVERQHYSYHSAGHAEPFLCTQTLLTPQFIPKADELLPPPGSELR